MADMQRLVVFLFVFLFVGLAAACGGKTSTATTPTQPAAPALPPVTDAALSKESLVTFAKERFPDAVADGTLILDFGSADMDAEIIAELAAFNVRTTGQLNAITPVDFQTKGFAALKAGSDPTSNITGLIRDLLIIHDAATYFDTVWKNSWVANGPDDFPVPAAYGVDMKILEDAGVFGGGGDPCDGYGEEGYDDPCAGDPCSD